MGDPLAAAYTVPLTATRDEGVGDGAGGVGDGDDGGIVDGPVCSPALGEQARATAKSASTKAFRIRAARQLAFQRDGR